MVIESLLLVVLIPLAIYSLIAPNLKTAIIAFSAFGLWVSFIYLYYHSPDVALAEAVIAGSLGTILFVFTIRNYNDIEVLKTKISGLVVLKFCVIVLAGVLTLYFTNQVLMDDQKELVRLVIKDLQEHGPRVYPIAGILLDYRLFDTVFEALILLIAGMDVAHMIKKRGE
jgi:multicomponent Na+:H+ antiporter subunit A